MTVAVDPWLTVEEVAGMLGVSISEVSHWILNSELPVVDLGPSEGVRVQMSDFNAFAAMRLFPATR
jgi:excisionase family DNA binding protein